MTEAKTKDAPKAQTTASTKTTAEGLPEGWELAHESEGYLIASKLVDAGLGQQRVSESGADMAALTAACEAYDAHQEAVSAGREEEPQPEPQTMESVDVDAIAAEQEADAA